MDFDPEFIEAIREARDCMRYMTPYLNGEDEEDVCRINGETFDLRRKYIAVIDDFLRRSA